MTRADRHPPGAVSRSVVTALGADGSLVVPPEVLAGLGRVAGDALVRESDGDGVLVRRKDEDTSPTRGS